MNRELQRLLAQAGIPTALDPRLWSRVLVVNNYGSVPLARGISPEFAQKGFKLIVLDRQGRPTHFVRCGAAIDATLEREGSILEVLGSQPELADIVPQSRSACSERLRVVLTSYKAGVPYSRFVRAQRVAKWANTVQEIIANCTKVTERAETLLPTLLRGAEQVSLFEEAVPSLRRLQTAGWDDGVVEKLGSALREVEPLPRRMQHGDLWPANVIAGSGVWWLIDFAEFGQVQVPMYDVFHMIGHCPGSGDGVRFILGAGTRQDEWTAAAQAVVRHWGERFGLSPRKVGAALLFYLIHVSAYRLRAGVAAEYSTPFLRDLRTAADAILSGVALSRLILP